VFWEKSVKARFTRLLIQGFPMYDFAMVAIAPHLNLLGLTFCTVFDNKINPVATQYCQPEPNFQVGILKFRANCEIIF
jgi:hypothetical protein